MDALQEAAKAGLKETICAPFALGSLRQMGLSAMVEIFAYEHMLAHLSSRISSALKAHRGLNKEALHWFDHHSEVDIGHAEEALVTLADYVAYYEFSDADADAEATAIIDGTLVENTFIKR